MALVCSSELVSFAFFASGELFTQTITMHVLSPSLSFPFPTVCNEVPEDPVLSPVSNNVFEKRLIVKYIHENGTDPINGEPLTEDQLLEIKG